MTDLDDVDRAATALHRRLRGSMKPTWKLSPQFIAWVMARFGYQALDRVFEQHEQGSLTPRDAAGQVFLLHPPPHVTALKVWLKTAWAYAVHGAQVIVVVPARTDAGWWHDLVVKQAKDIIFLRGRLHLRPALGTDAAGVTPYPVAVVRINASSAGLITFYDVFKEDPS